MQRVQSVLHKYPWMSPLIVLVLALIVFSLVSGGKFATPGNFGLITQQVSVVGTLAVGQTLIILTAGIDLSVGAVMVLSSMVMAKTSFENGFPGWLSLLAGFIVGLLAGAINGFLVTKVKLPPFIVTLGTLSIFTAVTLLYATGRTIRATEMAPLLTWLGTPIKLGAFVITIAVLLMLLLYIVVGYALRYTAWGRHVYATGDDPGAARLAGIEVNRVLFSVYLVGGLIFAIAGWVLIGRIQSAAPSLDIPQYALSAITAVVIGGTSLFGGRGQVIGTLIGALIVAVFQNGLIIAGLDTYYVTLAVGILVILAVASDQWIRKARA